ncbi:hypothetical protein [Streptomyces phaeolivaceus]|nr:hypothetical protein [Streptomyces phaeolivaceus]
MQGRVDGGGLPGVRVVAGDAEEAGGEGAADALEAESGGRPGDPR